MANFYTFEVHTPYRLFFAGQVEAVVVYISDGEIEVLASHSPFTASVSTGIIRIKDNKGQWKKAFTTEGIMEVKAHKTLLLVDAAEWPEEIDYDRALASKQSAEETIKSATFKFESITAEVKRKRAEMRLKAWELRKK
jgi:F-type H+-transporting ATPase subunit epsilon